MRGEGRGESGERGGVGRGKLQLTGGSATDAVAAGHVEAPLDVAQPEAAHNDDDDRDSDGVR